MSPLPPHQQRVVDEKKELDEKREKLLRFFMGDIYKTLPVAEQDRLSKQETAMKIYSDILGERVLAFETGPVTLHNNEDTPEWKAAHE